MMRILTVSIYILSGLLSLGLLNGLNSPPSLSCRLNPSWLPIRGHSVAKNDVRMIRGNINAMPMLLCKVSVVELVICASPLRLVLFDFVLKMKSSRPQNGPEKLTENLQTVDSLLDIQYQFSADMNAFDKRLKGIDLTSDEKVISTITRKDVELELGKEDLLRKIKAYMKVISNERDALSRTIDKEEEENEKRLAARKRRLKELKSIFDWLESLGFRLNYKD